MLSWWHGLQATAAADAMTRRTVDERLVTAVLEHLLLARASARRRAAPLESSQRLAAAPADFEKQSRSQVLCEAPEESDELWLTGGSAAVGAPASVDVSFSEESRAAARRVAQLRAAQTVRRRRLLLTAAGSAVRTAVHVNAGRARHEPSSAPALVKPPRRVAVSEQSGMAAIPFRMPECPPSRSGRRQSVWAPAHADNAPVLT